MAAAKPEANGGAGDENLLRRFAAELLGLGPDPGLILGALKAAPDCPIYAAHAAHLLITTEDAASLRAAAAPAETAARSDDAKAAGLGHAAKALLAGDNQRAAIFFELLNSGYPQDLTITKWAQTHAFNTGDLAGLLRVAQRSAACAPDAPYVQGMLAFGLEENHDLRGAEAAARRALEIERQDPWAHHALLHVYETEGRTAEGRAAARSWTESWDRAGLFIREHNWWHAALFALADKDYPDVLDIFDRQLWGHWPEFSQEQIGAIGLLWRLDLLGQESGGRWETVAAAVAAREDDHIHPYLDAHYAYALARTGKAARLDGFLASLDEQEGPRWEEIGQPLVHGAVCSARGDHQGAAALIKPIQHRLQEGGGSHAQRDLFVMAAAKG